MSLRHHIRVFLVVMVAVFGLLGMRPALAAELSAALSERVADLVVAEVADISGWDSAQVEVTEIHLPGNLVLSDDMALQVDITRRGAMFGRLPFRLTYQTDTGWQGVWATARVEVMVEALVATVTIGRHQVIESRQVSTTTVPLSRLPDGAISRISELLGNRAVQRIAPGRPLTRRMVEAPPVVSRGDQVTLVVHRPGLTISTLGEARQDGAPNKLIQVMNLKSRRTVQGRVVDATTVEVNF